MLRFRKQATASEWELAWHVYYVTLALRARQWGNNVLAREHAQQARVYWRDYLECRRRQVLGNSSSIDEKLPDPR